MYVQDYTNIKEKILESIQRDQNVNLDTSAYSYISQLTNLIAVSDDNILFYIGLLFNEISYENALLPETIYNMNKVLGGSPFSAIPPTGTIKINIITNTLDNDIFTTIYKTTPITNVYNYYPIYEYKVSYNSAIKKTSVSYSDKFGNIIPIPSVVEIIGNEYALSFEIKVKQEESTEINFVSEENIYEYDLPNIDNITNVRVIIGDIEYVRVQSTALLEKFTFTFDPYSKKKLITFATAINGSYIPPASNIKIIYYHTAGAKGNIGKNKLSLSALTNSINQQQLGVLIENQPIDTGASDIDLIDLKAKIYNELLLRDTIMSKKYDYNNIRKIVNTDSDNLVAFRTLGLVPKTSIFVDLKYNGKILRTNTVTIDNYFKETNVQQGMSFSNLGYDDHIDFNNSSNFVSIEEIAASKKPVVSPFVIKYNESLKLAQYFLYINGSVSEMVPNYSIKSTIDGFTVISYDSVYMNYNDSDNTESFKMQLVANTTDVNALFTDEFEFYGELYIKKNSGLKKIKSVSSAFTDVSSKITIGVANDGGIYAEIRLPVGSIEVSYAYILKMYIKHRDVLISEYTSKDIIIYNKMPFTSPVTRHSVVKHYTKISTEYDNNLEYNDDNGDNLVPDGFRAKVHGTFNPGLISYNIVKSDIDTSTVKMSDFDFVQLTINTHDTIDGRIIASYDDSMIVEFDMLSSFNIDEYYDFVLYISGYNTELNSSIGVPFVLPTQLNVIPGSIGISIHNVPVVAYDDYIMLKSNEDLSLITNRLLTVYDNVIDKALFGTQISVNFVKTYGWVQNIKYNTSIKYDSNAWTVHNDADGNVIEPIELPLKLNMNVVNKDKTKDIETVIVIKRLVNEYFKSIEDPGLGFSRSRLLNKIIDELPNVFSIDFEKLNNDIIYDFDQDDVMYDSKEFKPELLTLGDLHINI